MTSGKNEVGVILEELMKTKVVDMIRKSDGILVDTMVLETGLAIINSVYASQVGFAGDPWAMKT